MEAEVIAHPWVVPPPNREPFAYFSNVKDGDVAESLFVLKFWPSMRGIVPAGKTVGRCAPRPTKRCAARSACSSMPAASMSRMPRQKSRAPGTSAEGEYQVKLDFVGSQDGAPVLAATPTQRMVAGAPPL